MKKSLIVIGATLLLSNGILGYEYYEGKKEEKKVIQYETYLSSILTSDTAKMVGSTNYLSRFIDNAIENKAISPEEKAIVIGQMFELMDISSKTEQLAVATESLDNESTSYLTSNTLYFIGMYLSQLDDSQELAETDLEKLRYIQTFTTEWREVSNKELPQLKSQDGFNDYWNQYEKTMVNESSWKDVVIGMDQATTRLLSDKKLKSIESFLIKD